MKRSLATRLKRLPRKLYRKLKPLRAQGFLAHAAELQGRTGFEIGGPSSLFGRKGLLPVYEIAARVDNCNFERQTVWEGSIQQDQGFSVDGRRLGSQFIAEATDLGFAKDASYDFVLSSHALEHSANPIKALLEWKRILRGDGLLLLVLPHKDGTFDHRRPVTALAHMVADFEVGCTEADMTHLDEILALHDLSLDPGGGTPEEFKARSLNNEQNRCFHQHVFDPHSVVELLGHTGFQVLSSETFEPYHIVTVCRKPAPLTARG